MENSKYKERAIQLLDEKVTSNLKLFDLRYVVVKNNSDVLKSDLNKDILDAMCQLAEEVEQALKVNLNFDGTTGQFIIGHKRTSRRATC